MVPRSLKGIDGIVEAWCVTGEKVVESRFEAVRGQSLLRLVGRQHELALLRDRWELAKNSEGQVLLLSGEAGIGQSRLIQALMEFIEETTHFSLRFQCSPYHTNSAFNPIIRQIERAARFERDDGVGTKLDKIKTLLDRDRVLAERAVPPIFCLCLTKPRMARWILRHSRSSNAPSRYSRLRSSVLPTPNPY